MALKSHSPCNYVNNIKTPKSITFQQFITALDWLKLVFKIVGEIVSHQDGRWKTKLIGTMMDWPPQAIFPGTHQFIFTAKAHLCLLFKPTTNIQFTYEECFYQHTWTHFNGMKWHKRGIQIQNPVLSGGIRKFCPDLGLGFASSDWHVMRPLKMTWVLDTLDCSHTRMESSHLKDHSGISPSHEDSKSNSQEYIEKLFKRVQHEDSLPLIDLESSCP